MEQNQLSLSLNLPDLQAMKRTKIYRSDVVTKTCNGCGETMPIELFKKDKDTKSGYGSRCLVCVRAASKAWHKKKRESDPEGYKKMQREAFKKHYHSGGLIKQKEKLRVRAALGNAVRRGDVERLPCEICGDPASEGHHDDYSKPLEVRWLCRIHHKETHVKLHEREILENI